MTSIQGVQCTVCSQSLPASSFSKTQLRNNPPHRPSSRRACKACIEHVATGPGACIARSNPRAAQAQLSVPLPSASVSSSQPADVSPSGATAEVLPAAPGPLIDIGINVCSRNMRGKVPSMVQRAKQAGVPVMLLTGTRWCQQGHAMPCATVPRRLLYSILGTMQHTDTVGILHESRVLATTTTQHGGVPGKRPCCCTVPGHLLLYGGCPSA